MPQPSPTRRVVVLLHQGQGDPHVDILIERDDGPLVSFRAPVGTRLDLGPGEQAAFDATRIGEHRRVYLAYEGPISGGRGSVRRLATHTLRDFLETAESLSFAVLSHPAALASSRWSLHRVQSDLWRCTGRGTLE